MSGIFFRIFFCLLLCSFCLYSYLNQQNRCTELKMKLPKLTKEIQAIREVNANYAYQIECFENPEHLLALANQPTYSHLKFPFAEEILTLKEGPLLQWEVPKTSRSKEPARAVFIGAKP